MERKEIVRVFAENTITAAMINAQLPEGISFHSVLNPGGERRKRNVFLLPRGEDYTGHSSIVGGRLNKDNVFELMPGFGLFGSPGIKGYEDPRMVWSKDLLKFVITFVTAYQDKGPVVSLAIADKKLSSCEVIGDAKFIGKGYMERENKDACVLPMMVNRGGISCFAMIHRPIDAGIPKMFISFCETGDLRFWNDHIELASPRGGTWWDADRIGLSTQPIRLPKKYTKRFPEGVLLIYHGVKKTVAGGIYRGGLMWLSLREFRITHRTNEWVMGSNEGAYSVLEGDVHTVVFPTAAWYDERIGKIVIWYGNADTEICRAEMDIPLALEKLVPC